MDENVTITIGNLVVRSHPKGVELTDEAGAHVILIREEMASKVARAITTANHL